MPRRRLLGASTGAFALAVSSSLGLPTVASAAPLSVEPQPIPGGTRFLGPGTTLFHANFPAYGQEVSTITDFDGFVAAAEIQGAGTATDTLTDTSSRLAFDADMRFMQGVYVGVDGKHHHGTFAFIWLDLFVGQVGPDQVHDFEPGIKPSGLFWTIPYSSENVGIHLGERTASMRGRHVSIPDYHDFLNSVGVANPPIPTFPSTVSFDVHWRGRGKLTRISDRANQFDGLFADSNAWIAWSALEPAKNFRFVSDKASTSTTVSGVIGHERNGRFFHAK